MKRKPVAAVATLRTPQDVLEAIPCLLGFYPADCVVAVVVRSRAVHVTARWDLADAETPDGPDWFAQRLLCDSAGEAVDGVKVFLAGYGERDRASHAVQAVRDKLGGAVIDAVVVGPDSWWFANEDARAPGRPLARTGRWSALSPGPVAASRADLARSIAAPCGQREDDMMNALVHAIDLIDEDAPVEAGRRVIRLMDAWVRDSALSDADFLSAGVAMSAGEARDEVWRQLTRGGAQAYLPFWIEVASRTPRGVRVIVLGVTGLFAWMAGEGALMNICLEEAEDTDPDFSLIRLLRQIADDCLPPASWDVLSGQWSEASYAAEPEPCSIGAGNLAGVL